MLARGTERRYLLETVQGYVPALYLRDINTRNVFTPQITYGKLNMQKVCPNHNHKCWTLRIESYLIFSGAALFVCYFQAEENQMKTIRPP
jgi:hypothetical protein